MMRCDVMWCDWDLSMVENKWWCNLYSNDQVCIRYSINQFLKNNRLFFTSSRVFTFICEIYYNNCVIFSLFRPRSCLMRGSLTIQFEIHPKNGWSVCGSCFFFFVIFVIWWFIPSFFFNTLLIFMLNRCLL